MKTAVLLLLSLSFTQVAFADEDARKAQESDIREAAFRYAFNHNASAQQENTGAYYLSIEIEAPAGEFKSISPDDAFMGRFTEHKPPVKKRSECSSDNGEVVDKNTGKEGLLFTTGAIKWLSDTEVEISGGYYEAGLSASGNTYRLKKTADKWKIIKDTQHWIS